MAKRRSKLYFSILAFLTFNVADLRSQCYIQYGWKWPGQSVTYHINSNLSSTGATQSD